MGAELGKTGPTGGANDSLGLFYIIKMGQRCVLM